MTMLRGYMPLGIQGIFPGDDAPKTRAQFFMPQDFYDQILDDTPWIFDDLKLLEQLINVEPEGVILRNLKREGFEDAFCYSCRPAMAVQDGVFVGFVNQPPSHAFLGPVLFAFEWRDEDEDRPGFPKHWQRDFGGVLWERT